MKRIKGVRQINDTMTHWTVEINGVRREFDAQITEQQPKRRAAHLAPGAGPTTIWTAHCRNSSTFDTRTAGAHGWWAPVAGGVARYS
jgi:hypothetical protein